MNDERSSSRKRKGKRRFFRPKRGKEDESTKHPESEAQQAGVKVSVRRTRKTRRRSRARQRASEEAPVETMTLEGEDEYLPPQTVFVYTYSVHPEMRDSAVFRPDHFSRVGRKLEDYEIDLGTLFRAEEVSEDGMPRMVDLTTKPAYDWQDWEEEE